MAKGVMTIHEAVEFVNTHNRPDGKPMVAVVTCSFCGAEFARMVTDAGYTAAHGKKTVCPRIECQRAARRSRQGGKV